MKSNFLKIFLPPSRWRRRPSLFACAACYGKSDSPLASGMNWGIFTLLGVIVDRADVHRAFLRPRHPQEKAQIEKRGRKNMSKHMKEWFANHILGMPELASKNGQDVDALIVYVHWLMLALFIGWMAYFFYASGGSRVAQSQGRLRRRPQPCVELHRTGRRRPSRPCC
jgi:hypothetical protein